MTIRACIYTGARAPVGHRVTWCGRNEEVTEFAYSDATQAMLTVVPEEKKVARLCRGCTDAIKRFLDSSSEVTA